MEPSGNVIFRGFVVLVMPFADASSARKCPVAPESKIACIFVCLLHIVLFCVMGAGIGETILIFE